MKSAAARILLKNMDRPIILKIEKIVDENPNVKTFYFSYALKSQPGQFVMLWIPGTDQKPFSLSSDNGEMFGLTVFKRGPLTEKLFSLPVGGKVGISGPYGTAFTQKPTTHYIMVAGGYGAAPLAFLADKLSPLPQTTVDFLIGARNAENLLFENRLNATPNVKLHIFTNDGSRGEKGLVTDPLPELLKQNINSLVVTCGPELMEKKILEICNEFNVECEVSIERYMKCGMGICGQCAVDPLGICMCTHGPVVNRELANQILEFGKYHRDKTGNIISF